MQNRLLTGLTVAALSLGMTAAAHAGGTIVTNEGYQVISTPTGQGAYDNGLMPLYAGANQDVALAKDVRDSAALYANHSTVYIDPQDPYRRPRGSRLDQGHSIHRAQRLYNSLHAMPTRVIRRVPVEMRDEAHTVRPVLIMLKPDALRKQQEQRKIQQNPGIPSVPRHEKKDGEDTGLMARAD